MADLPTFPNQRDRELKRDELLRAGATVTRPTTPYRVGHRIHTKARWSLADDDENED